MRGVTSGSVSSSATGANVGALDGVGRAADILCAEVDEEDIELTTGTVLGKSRPHPMGATRSTM